MLMQLFGSQPREVEDHEGTGESCNALETCEAEDGARVTTNFFFLFILIDLTPLTQDILSLKPEQFIKNLSCKTQKDKLPTTVIIHEKCSVDFRGDIDDFFVLVLYNFAIFFLLSYIPLDRQCNRCYHFRCF